jgi:hypothetical protein
MRKQFELVLQALLAAALAASMMGCAATSPPTRIQSAIHTINHYMPEYVTEANKAIEATDHPDMERLTGIGDRLAAAIQALDAWANGQEKEEEKKR